MRFIFSVFILAFFAIIFLVGSAFNMTPDHIFAVMGCFLILLWLALVSAGCWMVGRFIGHVLKGHIA